jgi:hypothetical protein
MVLIEANKNGAMWMRSIFRYYCRQNNCTVIRMSKNELAAEGAEEDRIRAEFEYERAVATLLIKIVNARAKHPHSNKQALDNLTIRTFAKELWGV